MKTRKGYTCPLELTHDVIKGKWKPIILWQLWQHQSLSELKEGIAGISQKMLIEQLKELMEYGMVDKKSYEGYPLRVEYFLTERGQKMRKAVEIMQSIGIEMMVEQDNTDFLKEKGLISEEDERR